MARAVTILASVSRGPTSSNASSTAARVLEMPTTNADTSRSDRCSKCGTVKKTGKLSCCARGGTWFEKCGDTEDPKFEHTWAEGIQACNELASAPQSAEQGHGQKVIFVSALPGFTEPPVTVTHPSTANPVCPKCGVDEVCGKLSCCARGGAWFQNCGDAGDTHSDHTWLEGFQACSELASSTLLGEQERGQSTRPKPINNATTRSIGRRYIVVPPRDYAPAEGARNSEDGVKLGGLFALVSLSFLVL